MGVARRTVRHRPVGVKSYTRRDHPVIYVDVRPRFVGIRRISREFPHKLQPATVLRPRPPGEPDQPQAEKGGGLWHLPWERPGPLTEALARSERAAGRRTLPRPAARSGSRTLHCSCRSAVPSSRHAGPLPAPAVLRPRRCRGRPAPRRHPRNRPGHSGPTCRRWGDGRPGPAHRPPPPLGGRHGGTGLHTRRRPRRGAPGSATAAPDEPWPPLGPPSREGSGGAGAAGPRGPGR